MVLTETPTAVEYSDLTLAAIIKPITADPSELAKISFEPGVSGLTRNRVIKKMIKLAAPSTPQTILPLLTLIIHFRFLPKT